MSLKDNNGFTQVIGPLEQGVPLCSFGNSNEVNLQYISQLSIQSQPYHSFTITSQKNVTSTITTDRLGMFEVTGVRLIEITPNQDEGDKTKITVFIQEGEYPWEIIQSQIK